MYNPGLLVETDSGHDGLKDRLRRVRFHPTLMSIRARIALALPILLLSLTAACGTEAESLPRSEERGFVIIESANPERPEFHDFGEVPHGEIAEHTFKMVNTDHFPITIRDILPACGCTIPEIYYIDEAGLRVTGNVRSKGEVLIVPPRATVYVTMKTDTTEIGVPNRDKLSMVRLRCDSKNTAFMTFELHLIAKLLFQATPFDINMGQIAHSSGGSSFSEIIASIPGSGAKIIDIESSDPSIETTLTESVRFGVTLWTLTTRIPGEYELGPHRSEVVLRTTDVDGEGDSGRFKLGVMAQVVEDVVAMPPTASLGSFPREDGRTVETTVRTLVPGHRLKILGSEISGEGADELTVTFSPASPDDAGSSTEWIVALTIAPGATRDVYGGVITLELDDPQYPTLKVPYTGRVITP